MPGVNGNYAPHSGYGSIEQQNGNQYNGNMSASQPPYSQAPPPTSSTPATTASSQTPDVPKDEVSWYFVERYYTTLSGNPEKLYMFYNKRSQFVSGQETDKVAVCVGQRAINDRIKALDFEDCKVRVTNVDSQASDANIVIQVIGEMSNKGQPHRKFVQTFVLAAQTNGYFVLNDIFRYLIEEEDDEEPEAAAEPAPATEDVQQAPAAESGYQEPPSTISEVEPKTLTSSMDPIAVEHDAQTVDKELEEIVQEEKQPEDEEPAAPTTNGVSEEPETIHAEESPAAAEPAQPEPSAAAESTHPADAEADLKPEKPKDPEPTPSASPPKDAPAQPAAPSKPAAPRSWAALARDANKAAPAAAPAPASAQSTINAQPRAAQPPPKSTTPAASGTSAPPQASAPATQPDDSASAGQQDEWTAVSSNHNRQQSRQTNPQPQEGPQNRGYVKNVHEGIDAGELKAQLEQFGEVTYFDIHRQRVSWECNGNRPISANILNRTVLLLTSRPLRATMPRWLPTLMWLALTD